MQQTVAVGLATQIRLPQAVALYVGSVLGSGVLLIPGFAAGPSSVAVWFTMSLLALPMALTLGVLASRNPDAGGVSAFVRMAFGRPLAAVAGWFFLASVPIGATVAALAAASYVQVALRLSEAAMFGLAGLILAAGVVNNLLGVRFLGRSQVAISAAIVAVLAVAVGVAAPHVEPANFTPFAPNGWAGMGRAASLMFWCFIGWEAVTHLSEEFTDPRRDTIRSILIAALVVGVLYTAVGLVTVGTNSYGPGVSSGSLAAMVTRFLGPAGGMAIAGMAFFICLGTINAYVGAGMGIACPVDRSVWVSGLGGALCTGGRGAGLVLGPTTASGVTA